MWCNEKSAMNSNPFATTVEPCTSKSRPLVPRSSKHRSLAPLPVSFLQQIIKRTVESNKENVVPKQ